MPNASAIDTTQLTQAVQHNCHISDALYARNYSLCIYLLKMREFYRWEQGFDFRASLPKSELGEWLTARENLWETLEEQDYRPLPLDPDSPGPFDAESVNSQLAENGLVYSGGYCGAKPHFFLAELERVVEQEGARIYVAGRELAREITAPPALSLGNVVFLRRESLRRMIWEKLEEWGWQDPSRPIARAVTFYGFDRDFDAALEAMTADEIETLLEHELGEVMVGRELGPDWEAMLAQLPRSRAEYVLRAVRDHLVDTRRTLPWLLGEGREAALHFYMANFTTMRRELFPSLAAAYQRWQTDNDHKALGESVVRGAEHWQRQAENILDRYREVGNDGVALQAAIGDIEKELYI